MATFPGHFHHLPVPAGSTFEADLRAAREARGLSLEEIQKETRIPVDVLRRFEEADLAGDPSYNPVYLRAFLQSYARAVGLPRGEVLAAYEAHERGAYAGELHPDSTRKVPTSPAAGSPTSPSAGSGNGAGAPAPEPPPVDAPAKPAPANATPKEAPPASRGTLPPAVQALSTARPEPTPTKDDAAAPITQTRVNRPAVPTARRSFDKNWGTIIGLFVVLALVLGGVLWFLVFSGDDEPETDGAETVSIGGAGAEIDTSGLGTGAAAGAPQFQTPIAVTVTAVGNGLQYFRVTEDDEARTPHWIDAGASQTFEADSLLILWGEGGVSEISLPYDFAESIVAIQGQRFTPQSGTPLRIDRQSGQRLLDSLATAPSPAAPADAGGAIPLEDADAIE